MWFAVVAGNHQARLCYPDGYTAAMVQMLFCGRKVSYDEADVQTKDSQLE